MPAPNSARLPGIGLALSGGGFRATLFHVGALRRLVELEVLPKVTHFASVSGGSITAGVLAHSLATQSSLSWPNRMQAVETVLRDFCSHTIDSGTIIGGVLNPFRRVSDLLASKYDNKLFHGLMLSALPPTPEFTFCATNLQTGRLVHLSRTGIVDYRVGTCPAPVSLARAVAASSAFPPFLSPVVVDTAGHPWTKVRDLSVHNADPQYTKKVFLADGGAYDNMGLEPVWDRHESVLVSDAGAPYVAQPEIDTDWLPQLHSAFEIATDQSRGVRKRWLVEQYQRNAIKGTYWGINTKLAGYQLADAVAYDPAKSSELARMRTRLDRFSKDEQDDLIDWGYVVCDTALRRWCPTICANLVKPTRLPGTQAVV